MVARRESPGGAAVAAGVYNMIYNTLYSTVYDTAVACTAVADGMATLAPPSARRGLGSPPPGMGTAPPGYLLLGAARVTDIAIPTRAKSSASICEDCAVEHKNYGLAEEGYMKRWCGACAKENHVGATLKPVKNSVKVAAPAAARKPVQSRKRAKSRQPVTVKSRKPIMM